MNREQIIKLTKKNIDLYNLETIKELLKNNYEISYGKYENIELKKAINNNNPVFIKDNFLIGYDIDGNFVTDKEEKITIDKPVNAIIVEDEKEEIENIKERDFFSIIGNNEWENIGQFDSIIGNLAVGEIFLPPHSAIFNFLIPTEKQEKENIVSMLSGININIYSQDNYIDNCIHEIGHLFWRDCVKPDEKDKFKELFNNFRPNALFEYEWESKNEEEIFCTIYKWYVKSLLINKSFYNILEFEDKKGLILLQEIFDRIARERIIEDVWTLNKEQIFNYLNPKLDITTGKYIMEKGLWEKIKDIEIPEKEQDIDRFANGMVYVNLAKAVVPIRNNKIYYDEMTKTISVGLNKVHQLNTEETRINENKKIIAMDMDGVVADFAKSYKESFGRDANKDDPFTIQKFCETIPHFFRMLPVNKKGKDLFNELIKKYNVYFLTTPMGGMEYCKRDKIEWVQKNFGNFDIVFNNNKAEYVIDDQSILIDDMTYNLSAWSNAGGTAINFNKSNEEILNKIKNVFSPQKSILLKKELDNIETPTEAQKIVGNYKKGEIIFKGIKIKIENPKGSIRWGIGENGKKWICKMNNHYGYIAGSDGNDNDLVDCFIGDKLNASRCFVVNQINPESGLFDEHKVMFGFDTIDEAKQAYLNNYKSGWKGFDSIEQTNTKKLREWLLDGNKKEPFNPNINTKRQCDDIELMIRVDI